MTDEQMKKLLEEDTGEVPERFHQAMLAAFGQMEDEPFDGTELPISVEAAEKPRRPRHVPRQGGRFRRMMLVMLITLGQDFGFGPKRAMEALEAFRETFRSFAQLCVEDADGDQELAYTKESIDRELRRIMGDGFRPWEERYPPEVFR